MKLINKTFFDETGSTEALLNSISQAVDSGAKSLFILACDENNHQKEALDAVLMELDLPVFGGIFPQLIFNDKNVEKGSLVCALNITPRVEIIKGLSDANENYAEQAEAFADDLEDGATIITLVDGLATQISTMLEEIYEVCGERFRYLGGGTGSLSFEQKPTMFSNQGLLVDCAQLVIINRHANIAVEHGWEKFAGPFMVTSAKGNKVMTLDYRPAYEVYREVVEADANEKFTEDNFFDLAKSYPFGLDRLSGEVIVRDPLNSEKETLIFIAEVPENHLIHILKGKPENLINASTQAAKKTTLDKEIDDLALCFNCISRVLYLENNFKKELQGIKQELGENANLIGALTLGEIADSGDACLDFYNKTAVLGTFSEK